MGTNVGKMVLKLPYIKIRSSKIRLLKKIINKYTKSINNNLTSCPNNKFCQNLFII